MIIPPDILTNKRFHPSDLRILEEIELSEKILYKKRSEFHQISVVENNFGRFLKFDESYQAGILSHSHEDLAYNSYFLLSDLINPDIKRILILGLGTGNIVKNLKKIFPNIKKIDIVEIDQDVIDIAGDYFNFKSDNPVNLHLQDARVFIRNTQNKYDLIIQDIFSDNGMPYRFMTDEFLQEAADKLEDKGIFASNVFSLQDLNSDRNIIFKALLKTYKLNFGNVLVFPTIYGNFKLYKELFKLQHDFIDLTNVMLIASKSDDFLTKSEIIERAKKFQAKFNTDNLRDIIKYAEDLYTEEINTDSVKVFKDSYEEDPDFNFKNFRKFLLQ